MRFEVTGQVKLRQREYDDGFRGPSSIANVSMVTDTDNLDACIAFLWTLPNTDFISVHDRATGQNTTHAADMTIRSN